jgi:hypothetical protein
MKRVLINDQAFRLIDKYSSLSGGGYWKIGANVERHSTGEWWIDMHDNLIEAVMDMLRPGETFNDGIIRVIALAIADLETPSDGQHRRLT